MANIKTNHKVEAKASRRHTASSSFHLCLMPKICIKVFQTEQNRDRNTRSPWYIFAMYTPMGLVTRVTRVRSASIWKISVNISECCILASNEMLSDNIGPVNSALIFCAWLPIRKLLIDMLSSLGKGGENKKTAGQRSVFLPFALPNACEVSWRARAWKCPILSNYAHTLGPRIHSQAKSLMDLAAIWF